MNQIYSNLTNIIGKDVTINISTLDYTHKNKNAMTLCCITNLKSLKVHYQRERGASRRVPSINAVPQGILPLGSHFQLVPEANHSSRLFPESNTLVLPFSVTGFTLWKKGFTFSVRTKVSLSSNALPT